MLPSELARFKIRDDWVYPQFAGERELDLVREMISLYREGITLGEVEEEVKLFERVYGTTFKEPN